MATRRWRLALPLLGLALLFAGPRQAQEVTVPVAAQVPLLLKVLKYDRGFAERIGDELVLATVYQERFRSSLNAQREFEAAFKKDDAEKLFGVPCRSVAIELGAVSDLAAAVEREAVDVLYVTPLRAVSVAEVAAAVGGRGIVTLAAVPEYVEEGLVIGVTARRNRPSLLLNLGAARAEGFDFSSELLKVAQVIGR